MEKTETRTLGEAGGKKGKEMEMEMETEVNGRLTVITARIIAINSEMADLRTEFEALQDERIEISREQCRQMQAQIDAVKNEAEGRS